MSRSSSDEKDGSSLEKQEPSPQQALVATVNQTQRSRLFRVPFTSTKVPPPPKQSLDDADLIPEANAHFLSLVTFGWITPLLSLGYARPLEAPDLYKLQDTRGAARIAEKINISFERRIKAAEEYNARLENGEIRPGLWKTIIWTFSGSRQDKEKKWREVDGKKRASLIWAINDSIAWWFWTGGLLKVIGDTAQVTSPLLVKALINFATESFVAHKTGAKAPSIGVGIGYAFGLLALQVIGSLCTHHFFYRAMSTGVLIRGGLITAIYERSLKLTSRARSTLTNGKLVNHISTDAWTAPIQMIVCLIILLVNLGPSALAGFGFFILATPIQTMVMKRLFNLRRNSMMWTDKRAKLLQELLGGMKIIKYFAWETPFLSRIFGYRQKEMGYIRSLLIIRSAMNAVALSMPAIASVLAFVTYSLSGHTLNPALIFSSLTLFNLLRLPLMFLPVALSSIADASNAASRLTGVFEAELLTETIIVDAPLDVAVEVIDAAFTWDAPPPVAEVKGKGKHPGAAAMALAKQAQMKKGTALPEKPKNDDETVFKVKNISMRIPRGQLVAIVGAVGSGKTSLLQGIIGEMRRTNGNVKFGGSNATVRENICFGRPFEEERYWKAIHDSCLGPDLEMLPNGDFTEVGEKDPLSALDAHVGKAVFQNVLQNSSTGKTRVLVTHALHFLPQVDYIYTVADGRIGEHGTYSDLMNKGGEFSRFVNEFGSKDEEKKEKNDTEEEATEVKADSSKKATPGAALMQAEERNTGAISAEVYKEYLKAGKGYVILPLLLLSLVLIQGATVMSSYWCVAMYCVPTDGLIEIRLVYWQELKWPRPESFYAAITRVMHAPMSFFETTPLGRIMNRFSKDIDTIDNMLGDSLRMFAGTASSIIGAVILIAIVLPWFLIGVACILILYVYAAAFYRASARELKRLDAVLRSSLYSHFSESLSGLATIRAYGETERFRLDNETRVDIENRAYWLTVTNQRWLGIRLDFLGTMLTFVVSMLAVGTRFTISPAQTGLVLSYILSVQQAFGWLVRQSAEVENNMNSVERIVHYAKSVEQEAPHEIIDTKPPADWPAQGRVNLKDVVLSYRPELPPVLKGISMTVGAGEKIGIVGRTGAGKSSIMTALYRLVELTSGFIAIDDIDISSVGLKDLRSALAIIPQDPVTYLESVSGTLRSNLDPFGQHDDAQLWDALKRSYLVEDKVKDESVTGAEEDHIPSGAHTPINRFNLDSVIEDEGGNLSIGQTESPWFVGLMPAQRSLVSLARALVKDSKIIILDEATASVDYETDKKIQDTIATEFQDKTILCIARSFSTGIFSAYALISRY
ncbi:hypothetical protein H0H93_009871 [Arthromyces matolae]|nr:hypothetical protein H0H93_009871 [Arthromyces matolae]